MFSKLARVPSPDHSATILQFGRSSEHKCRVDCSLKQHSLLQHPQTVHRLLAEAMGTNGNICMTTVLYS